MADGLTNESIRHCLGLSLKTVESAAHSVFQKLDIADDPGSNRRVLAVRRYLESETIPTTELSTPTTRLIGRSVELSELDELLKSRRLVTITGPGGIGKSRLALEAAGRLVDDHRVRFVDLASTDELSARRRVFEALGISLTTDSAALRLLDRMLSEAPTVVVVDNAEHVPRQVADLVEIIVGRLTATVLVTSRVPLHANGEHVWRLAPLSFEDSFELLTTRIVEAGNPRHLDRELLAAWCKALDGMPLAIELAASRLAILPLDQIIQKRFELAAFLHEPREARHSSLARVLQETYTDLDPTIRTLIQRLARFRGGFALEAMNFMSAGLVDGHLDRTVSGLVASSLVEFDGARYRMLEPIRQFITERSSVAEQQKADERMIGWCKAFAADAKNGFLHDPWTWQPRLDAESGNIDAALDAAMKSGRRSDALEIVRDVWEYWTTGAAATACQRVSAIIEGLDGSESPIDRAWALTAAGRLAACTRQNDDAKQRLGEAIDVFTAHEDADGITVAGFWLARLLGRIDLLENCLAQAHSTRQPDIEVWACLTLARDQMRRPGLFIDSEHLLDRAENVVRDQRLPKHSAYTSLLRAEVMLQANWLSQTKFSVEQIDVLLADVEAFTRMCGGASERVDVLTIVSQNHLHHHRWSAARMATSAQLEWTPQTEDPIVIAEAILMAAAVLEHYGASEPARRAALIAGPAFSEWGSPLWLAFTLHPVDQLYPYATARGRRSSTGLDELISLADATAEALTRLT